MPVAIGSDFSANSRTLPAVPLANDSQPASMAHVKGAAFHEFLSWYAQRHGARALRDAAARIPPRHLATLDMASPTLGVIASTWYPTEAVHALLDGLTAGLAPSARRELAFTGSAAVMDRTLRGIYSVLFRIMATPERYARHASKLWHAYYDHGEIAIIPLGPESARSTVRDWDAHHPFLCELNWGAAAAIYRAMGMRDVKVVREACVAEGGGECRFLITWRR